MLFDRDGTLVVDVPYNGDPSRVQPVPQARAALERAAHAVASVPVGDGSWVSVSVGVAGTDHSGLTPGTLLARADRAMYEAKRAGGGAVVLDASTDTPAPRSIATVMSTCGSDGTGASPRWCTVTPRA